MRKVPTGRGAAPPAAAVQHLPSQHPQATQQQVAAATRLAAGSGGGKGLGRGRQGGVLARTAWAWQQRRSPGKRGSGDAPQCCIQRRSRRFHRCCHLAAPGIGPPASHRPESSASSLAGTPTHHTFHSSGIAHLPDQYLEHAYQVSPLFAAGLQLTGAQKAQHVCADPVGRTGALGQELGGHLEQPSPVRRGKAAVQAESKGCRCQVRGDLAGAECLGDRQSPLVEVSAEWALGGGHQVSGESR